MSCETNYNFQLTNKTHLSFNIPNGRHTLTCHSINKHRYNICNDPVPLQLLSHWISYSYDGFNQRYVQSVYLRKKVNFSKNVHLANFRDKCNPRGEFSSQLLEIGFAASTSYDIQPPYKWATHVQIYQMGLAITFFIFVLVVLSVFAKVQRQVSSF